MLDTLGFIGGYAWLLAWGALGALLALLGVHEVVGVLLVKGDRGRFPRITSWLHSDWIHRHRFAIAIGAVFFAQGVAYKELRDAHEQARGQAESQATELAALTARSQGLNEQNADLRLRLEQAEHARPIEIKVPPAVASPVVSAPSPPMPAPPTAATPQIEGVTLTQRQIPSPKTEAPYAIEVTVQVQSELSPFGIAFVTSEPIVGGEYLVSGASMTNGSTGTLNKAPKNSYLVVVQFPSITPQRPLTVVLIGTKPFSITEVVRVR